MLCLTDMVFVEYSRVISERLVEYCRVVSDRLVEYCRVVSDRLVEYSRVVSDRLGHGDLVADNSVCLPSRVETLHMLQIHVLAVACGRDHTVIITNQGVC